jgi:hypothetical protein
VATVPELGNATRVHQVMAGFIVWLSTQRVPTCRRADLHQATARFLWWRVGEPQAVPEELSFEEWRYYSWLGEVGAREAELATAREALALLRRYSGEDLISAIIRGAPDPALAADEDDKDAWSDAM